MIAISTITQDLSGNVELQVSADFRKNTARVSRVKTLDGGVYITHSGVSTGDRDVSINAPVTEAQAEKLWYIFNNYTFINISIKDGFFLAIIDALEIKNDNIKMKIMLKSQENA